MADCIVSGTVIVHAIGQESRPAASFVSVFCICVSVCALRVNGCLSYVSVLLILTLTHHQIPARCHKPRYMSVHLLLVVWECVW